MTEVYIGVLAGLLGYLAARLIPGKSKANLKAKAKADAMEDEALELLRSTKEDIKKQKDALKQHYYDLYLDDKKMLEDQLLKLKEQEKTLQDELFELKDAKKLHLQEEKKLEEQLESTKILKLDYKDKIDELINQIEGIAGLTRSEAKELLLEKTKEEARSQVAHIVRKYEEEAKAEAKNRANYIFALATSRFAGEYVAERLISVINLKDDNFKGRIIGKDGRNVKALETTLGVDIIVDETPNIIAISCFNLYRRAIATKVVELLIEDGRIQPARVEQIHEKVCKEFEAAILEEGRNVIMDLGLGKMSDELMSLVGKLRYRASYGQNALSHSIEVANLAGAIAQECEGDVILARRAGLLHDIGKALTQDHEGSHVDLGAMLAKRHGEHPVVLNAIYAHHGHEEAASIEAAAVCAADTLSAGRPGARKEVLAVYLSRVAALEKIASKRRGVKQAYAINAGREIRVIVNAKLVNDDEAVLLAREIASDIEAKVQYPGEIKVQIIRETRAVGVAK